MAPSRILDGSASGMGRSTECLCYSVDGEFCRKESLRQLFLKILVCLWSADVVMGRWVDQQSAFVTLLTENFAGKSHFDSSFSKFSLAQLLWP
jgi:hypothetical protein